MSARIMSLVWNRAPYKGEKLLTLMAIADSVEEKDREFIWNELARQHVALFARTTPERVDRFMRLFMVDGLIERAAPQHGTPIMRLVLPAEWEAQS